MPTLKRAAHSRATCTKTANHTGTRAWLVRLGGAAAVGATLTTAPPAVASDSCAAFGSRGTLLVETEGGVDRMHYSIIDPHADGGGFRVKVTEHAPQQYTFHIKRGLDSVSVVLDHTGGLITAPAVPIDAFLLARNVQQPSLFEFADLVAGECVLSIPDLTLDTALDLIVGQ